MYLEFLLNMLNKPDARFFRVTGAENKKSESTVWETDKVE
jgi:hypothetical protein